MGAATVVASAIVFGLVIIIAYIIVGTSLQTIDVVTSAQSKLTESQEERMRSSIEIWNSSFDNWAQEVYINITNSGSETLKDFEYWDLYIFDTDELEPKLYSYKAGTASWGEWNITSISPDIINPGLLDPEENAGITIKHYHGTPPWVKIATPTGISDSWYVL